MWKVPFNMYKVTGILLTLPGIGMVVFQDGNMTVEHIYGLALLFMAVIASISYSMTVKKLSAKYNTLTITTYQFVIGSIFFLPFFLLFGLDGLTPSFFSFDILSPLLSLAILCSCVSCYREIGYNTNKYLLRTDSCRIGCWCLPAGARRSFHYKNSRNRNCNNRCYSCTKRDTPYFSNLSCILLRLTSTSSTFTKTC